MEQIRTLRRGYGTDQNTEERGISASVRTLGRCMELIRILRRGVYPPQSEHWGGASHFLLAMCTPAEESSSCCFVFVPSVPFLLLLTKKI